MEAQILFQGCTFQQLAEATAAILNDNKTITISQDESDLVDRNGACAILHFNKTTLHKHTKSGRLKSYGIGGRVLYKKSELIESVTLLKR
ncbi:MAG: helix-turn-helix domain-containing protein [Flavobacterium sp.]|uniref:helix-turn-helix domain-containing protein n=1 Tax=Flavobacterium sp. TaxID=239 RepID=UPI003267139D